MRIAKSEVIHFLTDDQNLGKMSWNEKNIIIYGSFDEFFNSIYFKSVKDNHEKLKSFEASKSILVERLPQIKKLIKVEMEKNFVAKYFEDRYLPSDKNNEGIVVAVKDVSSIQIFTEHIKFIEEIFYLQVDVSANCEVEYLIFKPDSEKTNPYAYNREEVYNLKRETLGLNFKFQIKIPKADLDLDTELNIRFDKFEEMNISLNK